MSRSKRTRRTFLKLMAGAGAAVAGSAAGVVPEVIAIGAAPRQNLDWRQLTTGELAAASQEALASADGRRLSQHLAEAGFMLNSTASQGLTLRHQGKSARVIGVAFHSTDGRTAQLMHTVGTGVKTPQVAAAGIVARAADGTVSLDVYQATSDGVRAVESTKAIGRSFTLTNRLSGRTQTVTLPDRTPAATQGPVEQAIGSVSDALAWSCGDCELVFDILLVAGCAVSAYFMCLLCGLCGFPLLLLCGVLCALFFALICYFGDQLTRWQFCRYAGYC